MPRIVLTGNNRVSLQVLYYAAIEWMTNRIRLKRSLPVSFRISIQSVHVSAENDSVLVRRAHHFALLEKKGEIFEVDRRSVPLA